MARDDAFRAGLHLFQLGRLNGAIAHDIRNPLNTIQLNLELLRESLERDPESVARERRSKYVRVIKEELHRMHSMVESLLNQTRVGDGRAEPCDLRALLEELQVLVQAHCRRAQVTFRVTAPGTEVAVTGRADDLRWALLPLVLDSVDALPEGGGVHVTLETHDGQAAIAFQATPPAGAPDKPLTRDESALAAARAVVDGHGGRFQRSDRSGPDPRFRIELPLAESPHRGTTCCSQ